MFSKKGFSFIEILLVLAIASVLVLIISNVLSSFNKQKSLELEAEKLASIINEAKSKTLSSEYSSEYGVLFEQGKAILFKGTSFSSLGPQDREYYFGKNVEAYNISLNGGGNIIVFKRISGDADNYGSVGLRVKNDPLKTKTIKISASGIVNY